MSLNIKNEETYKLVKELAAMKGVSLTTAVKVAVRNEIEREKIDQDRGGKKQVNRYERLMAFADEYSRRVKEPVHSWEINALLYDENGLPK